MYTHIYVCISATRIHVYVCVSCSIWMANSREGASTRTAGPPAVLRGAPALALLSICSTNGRRNARVLPLPVCACSRTSRPASSCHAAHQLLRCQYLFFCTRNASSKLRYFICISPAARWPLESQSAVRTPAPQSAPARPPV